MTEERETTTLKGKDPLPSDRSIFQNDKSVRDDDRRNSIVKTSTEDQRSLVCVVLMSAADQHMFVFYVFIYCVMDMMIISHIIDKKSLKIPKW